MDDERSANLPSTDVFPVKVIPPGVSGFPPPPPRQPRRRPTAAERRRQEAWSNLERRVRDSLPADASDADVARAFGAALKAGIAAAREDGLARSAMFRAARDRTGAERGGGAGSDAGVVIEGEAARHRVEATVAATERGAPDTPARQPPPAAPKPRDPRDRHTKTSMMPGQDRGTSYAPWATDDWGLFNIVIGAG